MTELQRDTLAMATSLVRAASPTGAEAPALQLAERLLESAGLRCERQHVSDGRWNVLALRGAPRVLLTTHLDTVPGDLPVSVADGVLRGRGSCDAKGAAAAMIGAAADLVASGREDFGVLLVVGEETTSDGALVAGRLLREAETVEAVLLGEPTDNAWIAHHPGVLIASVHAEGRAAHSSTPRDAKSAIHALLDVLADLRRQPWPDSEALGPSLFQVGRIEGGTAANVVAERARADVMVRTGGDVVSVELALRGIAEGRARVEVTCSAPAVRFDVPPGAKGVTVSFASDAPFLEGLGRRFMLGPGSIRHAHAADEHVSGAELDRARETYAAWVAGELERSRS